MREIIHHTGRFSIVYSDYLEITGDACAAQLLSSLEYWTKCKISVIEEIEKQNIEAAKNNAPLLPVPELWLYEKIQDFVDSICGTFKRNKVLEALKLLKEKGFIESKPSPNPWDKTCFWRIDIEKIQDALKSNQVNGCESKKTKSPRVRIQTIESLNSNVESLNSDLEGLNSDFIESLNSNSHPYMILDPDIIQVLNSNSPLTPQGESEEGGIQDEAILVSAEDLGKEGTGDLTPHQSPTEIPATEQNLNPGVRPSAAAAPDPRFLPTDTTAENMATWKQIVATGAMRGERQPDPGFLEFYRAVLSGCTHYKGKDCNTNHAKAALSRLWKNEPLKVLAEAESWQKSKTKSSTQTRDAMSIPREERLALARAIQERKQAQQQAKGA